VLASLLLLLLITFTGSNFITRHFFLPGQGADEQDILTVTMIKGIGEQIVITGCAISIKALKDYYLRDEEYKKLMVQRVYHQLDMMKIKMEPGILLGVLRNIRTDIHSGGQFAPEMILKLSDLLSYILYESDARHVPVKKEINMVSDYSSLKELSFGNRFEPKFHITGNFDHQTITPLVLLPFLELTFPRENENNPEIIFSEINIHVNESEFHFKVETNLNFPGSNNQIVSPVFDNARQNLIINYPEKHMIKVEESENGFSIYLKLNLHYHPASHNQSKHPTT
jgi:LytS/YehU family sensor histidine kinase